MSRAGTELEKCPICESTGFIDSTHVGRSRSNLIYGRCSSNHGCLCARGQKTLELAATAWNQLCDWIRIGRAASTQIPMGRQPIAYRFFGELSGRPYVIIELESIPLPAPPINPLDVLRRWREADLGSVSDGAYLQLRKDRDAALEQVKEQS